MIKYFKKFLSKRKIELSEFDKNNPLGSGGERVDFIFNQNFDYGKLDMYQKNHYRRYEFALKNISVDDICGDFACGSGYGSIMLSDVASKVTGVDINKKVIATIKKRYKGNDKVKFINKDLLKLNYQNLYSTIISFETIEHFHEEEICKLFALFNKALVAKGKLIFSTPYMQEDSKAARELGFHQTFFIDENKIKGWLDIAEFEDPIFYYQDYVNHEIISTKRNPDFIICIVTKS